MINTFVSSSNIERLGWNHNTMYIQFHSGDVYAYEDVSFKVYKALSEAESVGQHFHRHIRSKFPYLKLAQSPFEPDTKLGSLVYNPAPKRAVEASLQH